MSNELAIESPEHSYAQIRNLRLLFGVRVVMLTLFILLTVCGLVATVPQFEFLRKSIADDPDGVAYLRDLGVSIETAAAYNFTLLLLQCVIWTAFGFFVFLHRSDDWLAILLSSILIGNGLSVFAYSHSGTVITNIFVIVQPVFAWMPIFPFLCLFPDGRFVPRWSRWLIPLSILSNLPLIYANYVYWADDITIDPQLRAGFVMFSLVFWIIGLLFLLLRLRRSVDGNQRQQIKQFAVGLFGIIAMGLFTLLVPLVPVIGTSAIINVIMVPLVNSLTLIGFVILLTFSVFRYRLWEIDLVLNRGIVYLIMGILLSIVFIGLMLILQAGLKLVLGQHQTTIAGMVSAAVIVALFRPVHLFLQRMVDRRLFGLQVASIDPTSSIFGHKAAIQRIYQGNLIGNRLGLYDVHDLIGRGGMGEIYRGYQASLNRPVAIKVLLPHLSNNHAFHSRFKREAFTVANLNHPNIIKVLDFGESQGLSYMVMEYIQGQDLATFLRDHQVLPLEEVISLVVEIVAAMDYAHQQGIIHRDIKPTNIMLRENMPGTKSHQPVLMDFGLTKIIDSASELTQSGAIGTLSYMAPEQIRSAGTVDHRADIYALGTMCYQMLTGKLPFVLGNQAALLFAQLYRPAPDPREVNPAIPAQVATAILRALEKDPNKRPASAGAFAAELVASIKTHEAFGSAQVS